MLQVRDAVSSGLPGFATGVASTNPAEPLGQKREINMHHLKLAAEVITDIFFIEGIETPD